MSLSLNLRIWNVGSLCLYVKRALKVSNQHAHERITFFRRLLQTLENDLLHGDRNVRVQFARVLETGPVQLQPDDFFGRFAGKRHLTGQEFESGYAVGKNIDTLIDR